MPRNKLNHLFLNAPGEKTPYSARGSGPRSDAAVIPDRVSHGRALANGFRQAIDEARNLSSAAKETGLYPDGIYIEVEGGPTLELALKSLDLAKGAIELMSTHNVDGKLFAVIFIPDGKIDIFLNKIDLYIRNAKDQINGNRNTALFDKISSLRRATFRSFWTDDPDIFPQDGVQIWWEIWLRGPKQKHKWSFNNFAGQKGIKIGRGSISFFDRTVILVYATSEQLQSVVELTSTIAETRIAKDSPEFFIQLPPVERAEWVDNLKDRTVPAGTSAPAVCILDTGINRAHPLLSHSLRKGDCHAIDPTWGTHDHDGHGSEMAGLALYGDLKEALSHNQPIALSHKLESVKILPPDGQNEEMLYGDITAEAVARVEVTDPVLNRIFSMAVASKFKRDAGGPSSWSAAIDNLAAGVEISRPTKAKRLFILCAGNRDRSEIEADYFPGNFLEKIHNPGQTWNGLTVGAITNLWNITNETFVDWKPLAQPGDLSPISATSMNWNWQWPIKPDIVLEGGNLAISPNQEAIDTIDDLSILTTSKSASWGLLKTTGGTSPSTAIAASIAGEILAKYPMLWPETVRAIIVHSASWTAAMTNRFDPRSSRKAGEELLRCFGYGIPDKVRALNSFSNALTIVIEDEIQPFEREKSKEMNLHRIPWPKDALANLGDTQVRLKITLSYFIEPSPGRRSYKFRHRYASHGLRFDIQTPNEKEDEFLKRINIAACDEDDDTPPTKSDSREWLLGPQLRSKGSIHSDTWEGPALQLAERNLIGVFPVIGWWRERPQLNRWKTKARYSLVVSLETAAQEVDLYTPISTAIAISDAVQVPAVPIQILG